MKKSFIFLLLMLIMSCNYAVAGGVTKVINSSYRHNITPDFFQGKKFKVVFSGSNDSVAMVVENKIDNLGGDIGDDIVVQVDFKSHPKTNLVPGRKTFYMDSLGSRVNTARDIDKEAQRIGYNPLREEQEVPINKLTETMVLSQPPVYEHELIVTFEVDNHYYNGLAKVETPYLDTRIAIQLVKALMNNFPGSGGYNTLAKRD